MLEKLDNNESVLLMYLASELPADDRSEIERMLAGDVSLRKQLASLRLAMETTDEALRAIEQMASSLGRSRLEPGSVAEAAAMRRIGRSMRSHLTRQIAERPSAPANRGLFFPWWAYPSAATAASVMAFLVWWANNSSNTGLNIPGDIRPEPIAVVQDDSQTKAVTRFWQQNEDDKLDQFGATERTQARELATITNASDDDAAVWKIGNGDE